MQTITLPELSGARSRAVELGATLHDDLSDQDVILDASAVQSAAQGFLDELVGQLLGQRSARSLRVVGAPAQVKKRLATSARIRSVADRLVFV